MATPQRPNAEPPAPPATPEECPRCQGLGWWVDRDTNTTHRCTCGLETAEYRMRLARAGIPRRFAAADFDNFTVPRGDAARRNVVDAARAWAQSLPEADHTEGLLFRGAPGTGKTHLAIAMLRAALAHGMTGAYYNFSDLLTQIRNSYDPSSAVSEEEILAPLQDADLVVLDDVGAETPKDFVRDRLYLVVNRRYEGGKLLIITTNCDEVELEARVGRRTASRLREMCSSPFPPFPPDDWRERHHDHPPSNRKAPPATDPRLGRMK